MKDLITALQIFSKYTDTKYPTHCEHDEMRIMEVDPALVSAEDKVELEKLGFFVSSECGEEFFISYRFGSA